MIRKILPLQFFNKFEFAPSNSPIGLIGFKNLRQSKALFNRNGVMLFWCDGNPPKKKD